MPDRHYSKRLCFCSVIIERLCLYGVNLNIENYAMEQSGYIRTKHLYEFDPTANCPSIRSLWWTVP